ncbi:glycosyl transferase [Candidatus Methanoperedens nitroreducens]|uniref:Glycosyl transferase n=1 Tax=Candidatus Methanoperedens nitratireducens TaxID=1392998 RepID=A0A062V1J3_9EURY|nr:glycosyltransferase [Candidatus Methanoperedens nitroreducens]KCZ71252.1 glycosyl transferase [Candidatus Methanoperedens nitroreducens]MDJ1420322.1 glycosyltransferase [Candidatus Methanoperedens sp.]
MSSVSVITSIFNESEDLFRECAQSISNQGTNFEWIIIDDGSSKNYRNTYMSILDDVTSQIHVIYLRLDKNSGLSVARNQGINTAKNDWIVVLDSDDRLAEDTIKTVKEIKSEVDLISFDSLYFSNKSLEYRFISFFKDLFEQYGKSTLDPFLWFDFYYHGIIIRNELLKRIGGYREDLRIGEDQDILLRATESLRTNQVLFIPKLGYEYRNNPKGVCATQWNEVRKNYELTMLEAANRRGGEFVSCRYSGAKAIAGASIDCYEYRLPDGRWMNWDSYKESCTGF